MAEENIGHSVAAFPRKTLSLLQASDGVTAYAQTVRFLFMYMVELDDWPGPVIILSSLTSVLSLVLACIMHSKTFIAEHETSTVDCTKRIMQTHVAAVVFETIVTTVMLASVSMGSASIALILIMPILSMVAIFVLPFAAFILNMKCYMLETRLHNKIKSADNEVNEAVEHAVAQSLIEKDGIEIV